MAYKFQLGSAVLSGSINVAAGAISGSAVSDTLAASIVSEIDDGEIPIGKLAATTISGKALGNNLDSLSKATNSGLAMTSYNGSAAVSDLALDLDDLAAVTSIASGDTFAIAQQAESGDPTKKITFDNMAAKLASGTKAGLSAANGILTFDPHTQLNQAAGLVQASDKFIITDANNSHEARTVTFANARDAILTAVSGDATIAVGGALTISASAVEGSMLNDNVNSGQTELASGLALTDELMVSDAGVLKRMDISLLAEAIDGAGLSNNSGLLDVDAQQTGISEIYNTSLKVGTAADQEYIDFGTSDQIHFVVNNTPVARAVAGTFIVDGNLHVSGTTTTVDSTTINVSSSFTFEGPVDAHETILSVGTPVADTTVQLPEFSSAGTYFMAAFAADPGATGAITATPAELNLIDGGTARGTTEVANGDGFLHNDNGTMRMTNVSSLATLFAGNGLAASDSAIRLDINGLSSAKTTLAQADLIGISDSAASNTAKKVTFSNLEDQIFGNVSGDATIAAGGALTIGAGVIEHGMLAENIITGQTELSLAAIDEADEILVHDADANEVKRYGIDNLRTFINAGSTPTPFGNADATLVVGVNFSNAAPSEDRTLTLPASPVEGQSVRVKANADMAGGAYIIQKAGSQTIDGVTSIKLESPHAAVELVYVGSDLWKVF